MSYIVTIKILLSVSVGKLVTSKYVIFVDQTQPASHPDFFSPQSSTLPCNVDAKSRIENCEFSTVHNVKYERRLRYFPVITKLRNQVGMRFAQK